jgi:Periplasmic binding protein
MKHFLTSLFALITAAFAAPSFADESLSKDIAARVEAIPIQTLTISDSQFLKGDAYGKPTTIAGVLRVAQGTGRLPVIILVPGSGGLNANTDVWDRQFLSMEISTFTLDPFAGRGIVSTVVDQSQLGRLNEILDVYRGVSAIGLPLAQGLVFTEPWYWDMNDANRNWTRRWQVEQRSKFPTSTQAGVYSAVIHYLKAVEALKSDGNGRAVAAKMKEMPTDDPLFGKGTVRVDGRKVHDAYLLEVKAPDQSKYPGDFAKLKATIPAAEAFRPLKEGGCPLVNG